MLKYSEYTSMPLIAKVAYEIVIVNIFNVSNKLFYRKKIPLFFDRFPTSPIYFFSIYFFLFQFLFLVYLIDLKIYFLQKNSHVLHIGHFNMNFEMDDSFQ